MNCDDSSLPHAFEPLALENTILFIVHMVKEKIIIQALELYDLKRLLDLKHLTDRSRYGILLEIVARTLTSDDFNLWVLSFVSPIFSFAFFSFVLFSSCFGWLIRSRLHIHDANFELVDLVLAIDVYLDSQCHLAVVIRGSRTLAFLQALIKDCFVPVEIVNRTHSLQFDIDKKALISNKIRMARLKFRVVSLNILWGDYSRDNFALFHGLKDAFYDRCDCFLVGHQVFSVLNFLKDNLGAIRSFLPNFHIKVELIILGWSVVAIASFVNCLKKVLVA